MMLANIPATRDPVRAIDVLDNVQYAGTETKKFQPHFNVEGLRIRLEEWRYRANAGLPLHHLTEMKDFPFRFDDAGRIDKVSSAWLSAEPHNPAALLAQVSANLSAKHYDLANESMT